MTRKNEHLDETRKRTTPQCSPMLPRSPPPLSSLPWPGLGCPWKVRTSPPRWNWDGSWSDLASSVKVRPCPSLSFLPSCSSSSSPSTTGNRDYCGGIFGFALHYRVVVVAISSREVVLIIPSAVAFLAVRPFSCEPIMEASNDKPK